MYFQSKVGAILTFLSIMTSAGTATAVTVKNCPKTLSYSFTNFRLQTDAQLQQKFRSNYELTATTRARNEIQQRRTLRNKMMLVGTRTGQCFYSNNRTRPTTAKFYTSNDRDLLRVMIPTRGERVGIYLQVHNYRNQQSPQWNMRRFGTVVVEFSKTLHNGEFDSAGFIGYVNSIKAN